MVVVADGEGGGRDEVLELLEAVEDEIEPPANSMALSYPVSGSFVTTSARYR